MHPTPRRRGDAGVAAAPAVPLSPAFQRGRVRRAARHRVEHVGDAAVSDIGLAVDAAGVGPQKHDVEVGPVLVSVQRGNGIVQACRAQAPTGLASAGAEAVIIPPRSPRANAHPEWFLLTSRTEVTGRMLIFS